MRLLKLDERVQQMVIDDMITTGHARALLGIEDAEKQFATAQKIFDENLSVRETEKLVKKIQNNNTIQFIHRIIFYFYFSFLIIFFVDSNFCSKN